MADQAFAPPPPAPAPEIALAQAPPPLASAPPTAGYRSEPAARSMAMKTMASPMPAAAAPASPPVADAAAANPNDTPAQELDKIRLLFVQHRRDEALQRLAAFRQAHPDMHLPDDLRAQLPDHD
jgi:Meckel syndrome type 1 protein